MSKRWLGFALGTDGSGKDGDPFVAPVAFLEVLDGYMRSVRLLTPRYDGRCRATNYLCGGGYSEGELTVCLWYGMLAHFMSWVQDRDANGQGKAASVWLDGQAYTGVKVASVRFNVDRAWEDEPIDVTLRLRGKHGEPERREWPAPVVLNPPILARECEVERCLDGEALSAFAFEAIDLTVDNRMGANPVSTRMDGISGSGHVWHQDLHRPVCGEEAMTAHFCPDLAAPTVGPYIMFPRLVVNTVETEGNLRVDGFQAFASTDGLTPAVVLV
jgi:hypothetical protein